MKWSIRLGSFRGIPVRMHLTFLLLLAWVGWIYWRQEGTASAVVSGIVFILGIFVCVLLHEFGHALTARRFGIRTRDVTLLPIGGHYTMDRRDAAVAAEFVGAETVIPMHYDTFPPIEADPEQFKSDVESKTSSKVVILQPGESHSA